MDEDKDSIYIPLVQTSTLFLLKIRTSNGSIDNKFSYATASDIWSGYGWRMVFDDDDKLFISGKSWVFKWNNDLNSWKKFPISNIDSVDQLMRINDDNYYISSYVSSSHYAILMFE